MIRPAQISDTPRLTEIIRQSKAYWGYSAEQLKEWEDELCITEEHLRSHRVFNYRIADKITAFYSLRFLDEEEAWLENLFVLPRFMGSGQGSLLLEHAIEDCLQNGRSVLQLESDPHAESFYGKKDFEVVGHKPTSIAGRYLPIMRKKLT